MKEKIRLGYIGLGRRGFGVFSTCFVEMPDVEIAYVCDPIPERMDKAADLVVEKGRPAPIKTTDYKDILKDPTVDAVAVMTGWKQHISISKDCVLAGKYTAVEVGCAYDIKDCYDLIEAYEKTKAPLMMLENCCYGRREMMVLNMVKQGLFGEVVHCAGGYHHYLPICDLFADWSNPHRHYRISEYVNRNCEQYPTHELGPIAKVLGINRGNRMLYLNSIASKSAGLKDYVARELPDDEELKNTTFKQGDIVTTCITCANGETITLTLDTTLPRPYYSRNFTVRGTHGMATEERMAVFLEGMEEGHWDNESEFYEKYDHPLHAEYTKLGERGGHDGMDWLVCRAFVESVKAGIQTPIDAYDTVSWMCIAPLSAESVRKNGAPVEIPDFTNGKWANREEPLKCKYSLDEVVRDDSISIY